jgi:hypothetical protein
VPPVCSNCGANDFVWANELKTGSIGGGTLSLRSRGELSMGTRICKSCGHADLFLKDPSILRQPHTWRPGEFVPIPAPPAPAAHHSHHTESAPVMPAPTAPITPPTPAPIDPTPAPATMPPPPPDMSPPAVASETPAAPMAEETTAKRGSRRRAKSKTSESSSDQS